MKGDFFTIPSQYAIKEMVQRSPRHMHPNPTPNAVIWEGVLEPAYLRQLSEAFSLVPEHHFPGCHAKTRQLSPVTNQVFATLVHLVWDVNDKYFHFDIDLSSVSAYLQTYGEGGKYTKHTDGAVGQSRKLTAVVLMSESTQYQGGELVLHTPTPLETMMPKTGGTVVIFPAWVVHEVLPIRSGFRQSINLGFWGPPFK